MDKRPNSDFNPEKAPAPDSPLASPKLDPNLASKPFDESRVSSYGTLHNLPQLAHEHAHAHSHAYPSDSPLGKASSETGVQPTEPALFAYVAGALPGAAPVPAAYDAEAVAGATVKHEAEAGPDDAREHADFGLGVGVGEYRKMAKSRMVFLTFAVLMTYFLGTASSSAPTLLIPSIARDLGSTELETQWVASSYTLAFACGLLFSGRLADIFGRKRLYLIGLATYLVFAVLTGAIKSRMAMCLTRAFSGLGLSIASPAGFGIVGVNIRHEPARTIVFASFGLGNPVGAAFGTLLGGAMAGTGQGGWSYLFYLLAGLCLCIIVVAYFAVPPDPRRGTRTDPCAPEHVGPDRRIDWLGGALVTAAICLFTFSLTESGIAKKGWAAPHVPALLVLSLILFALFATWSYHLENRTSFPPIIKMSLFTGHRGRVGATCACAFFCSLSVYGFVYTTTAYYQSYRGLGALGNAVKLLTCNIVGVLAAGAVMLLAPRVRTPYLLGGGAVCTAAASMMYAVKPEGITYWAMEFPAQCLLPFGIDFAFGLGNILVSNLVAQSDQSVGGALFQTSGQVGAALGICLSALVTSQVAVQQGELLRGIKAAFWFDSATCFVVVAVVLFSGLRTVGLAKDVANAK